MTNPTHQKQPPTRPKHRFLTPLVWLCLCLLFPATSHAHMTSMGQMVSYVDSQKATVDILVSLSTRDVGSFLKLDRNNDKRISRAELTDGQTTIAAYLTQHLIVSNDSTVCPTIRQQFVKQNARNRLFFVQKHQCQKPLRKVLIENTIMLEDIGGYRHYAKIQIDKRTINTVFSRVFTTYKINFHPTKPAPRAQTSPTSPPTSRPASSTSQGFMWLSLRYIWEGIIHILIGLDHVLFVLSLIIVASGFRKLVGIVSAFTVGHSLTLILSTLQVIQLPPRFTEAAIALSIAYVAAENIIKRDSQPKHRYLVTFCFGLIHGVGFSYVLREILNLKDKQLLSSLLSFNIGVELGQLLIITVAFPFLLQLNKHPRYKQIMVAASTGILAVSVYWFIERLFS